MIIVMVAQHLEGYEMQNQLMPVKFYEDTVVLVGQDNEPFVAMKPIVVNMGLDWKSQHSKLAERFSSVMVEITTTGGDGKQYEMSCLPLRKLAAWLYSISPNKVKPELRDKIIRYQEECDDALWDYWTKGSASRPGSNNVNQQIALSRHRVALLKELHRTRDNGLRAALHDQLAQTSRQLCLSVPALDTIGKSAPPVPDVAKNFWAALKHLEAINEPYNHAVPGTNMVALNYPHLARLFKKHSIPVMFTPDLRVALSSSQQPVFIAYKNQHSQINHKTTRCWIFEGLIMA